MGHQFPVSASFYNAFIRRRVWHCMRLVPW